MQTSPNFTFSAYPAFVSLFAEPLMLKNDEKQRLARERREELEKQNGMTNMHTLSFRQHEIAFATHLTSLLRHILTGHFIRYTCSIAW